MAPSVNGPAVGDSSIRLRLDLCHEPDLDQKFISCSVNKACALNKSAADGAPGVLITQSSSTLFSLKHQARNPRILPHMEPSGINKISVQALKYSYNRIQNIMVPGDDKFIRNGANIQTGSVNSSNLQSADGQDAINRKSRQEAGKRSDVGKKSLN